MKRFLSFIIITMLLFSSLPMNSEASSADTLSLFVKSGATNGTGSMDAPFGTLEEARDYIRTIKENGNYPKNGVTVYLRGGNYNLNKGIKFDKQDSGTKEGPITYRAYKEENVNFSAGVSINLNQFKKVTDNTVLARIPAISRNEVLELNLFDMGFTKEELGKIYHTGARASTVTFMKYYGTPNPNSELFFDGEAMTLARWPNDDYTKVGEVVEFGTDLATWNDVIKTSRWIPPEQRTPMPIPSIIKGGAGRLASWKTAPDAWVHGYWAFDWLDCSAKIDAVDPVEGTIKLNATVEPVAGKRFFAFNLLEELDIKGEWYLERETGILYFYPPKKSGTATLSLLLDDLFTLENVENVNFKALNLNGARGRFFNIRYCRNINIENSSLSFCASEAINISRCYDCSVKTCNIFGAGRAGVNLDGGDFTTLDPGNNVVENCWLHKFSRLMKNSAPGVDLRGVGNKIIYNRINDAPQWAIRLGGNDHIIEYNDIYDVLKESADAGVIYAWGEITSYGTYIRNNYIHDCVSDSEQTHGIMVFYFDELYSGTVVESNIVENFPGHVTALNGSRDTIVRNNILINCNDLIGPSDTGMYGLWNTTPGHTTSAGRVDQLGIGEKDPRYSYPAYKKYPHLSEIMDDLMSTPDMDGNMGGFPPKRNVLKNNVGINLKDAKLFAIYLGLDPQFFLDNNELELPLQISNDPGFIDYAGRNYILKEDSLIYDTYHDFVPCDFKNVGIYTPKLLERLGDAVSMRINSPVYHKGLSYGMVDAENDDVTPLIHNDKTMVPIRFMAEIFGGTADWESDTGSATIIVGENILTIASSGEMKLNDALIEGESAININGRLLVPLRVISESMNKKVDWYDQGMIIVSDKGNLLEKDNDSNMVEELYRRLSFR